MFLVELLHAKIQGVVTIIMHEISCIISLNREKREGDGEKGEYCKNQVQTQPVFYMFWMLINLVSYYLVRNDQCTWRCSVNYLWNSSMIFVNCKENIRYVLIRLQWLCFQWITTALFLFNQQKLCSNKKRTTTTLSFD